MIVYIVANAKPYDDLYDYYRFCVGVEVVE